MTPHRRVFRFPCYGPAGPDASGSRDARLFQTSFANAETKMPPAWSPRAFAVPRKIGVTDLPRKESVRVGWSRLRTQTARAGLHRALAAMAAGGWRCGSASTWSKYDSTRRNGPRGSARVRTLLALIDACKRNFHVAMSGPASRPSGLPERTDAPVKEETAVSPTRRQPPRSILASGKLRDLLVAAAGSKRWLAAMSGRKVISQLRTGVR